MQIAVWSHLMAVNGSAEGIKYPDVHIFMCPVWGSDVYGDLCGSRVWEYPDLRGLRLLGGGYDGVAGAALEGLEAVVGVVGAEELRVRVISNHTHR